MYIVVFKEVIQLYLLFLWLFTLNIQAEKADHAIYMEILKWPQQWMI